MTICKGWERWLHLVGSDLAHDSKMGVCDVQMNCMGWSLEAVK